MARLHKIISFLLCVAFIPGAFFASDSFTQLEEDVREHVDEQVKTMYGTPEEAEEPLKTVEMSEKEQWEFIQKTFDTDLRKKFDEDKSGLIIDIIGVLLSTGAGIAIGYGAQKLFDDKSTSVLCGGLGGFAFLALMAGFEEWYLKVKTENRDYKGLVEFLREWPEHEKSVPDSLKEIFKRLYQLYQKEDMAALKKEADIVQIIRDGYRGKMEKQAAPGFPF